MSWTEGTVPRRAPENFPEPGGLTRPTAMLHWTYRLSQGWSYPCPEPSGEVTMGQVQDGGNRAPVKAAGPRPPRARGVVGGPESFPLGGDGDAGGACGLAKGIVGYKAPPTRGEPCGRRAGETSGLASGTAAVVDLVGVQATQAAGDPESPVALFKAAPMPNPLPPFPPTPKRRPPSPPPSVKLGTRLTRTDVLPGREEGEGGGRSGFGGWSLFGSGSEPSSIGTEGGPKW